MELYFDGKLFASSPDSEITFTSNYPLLIGSDSQTTSDYLIDNVRLYNEALSGNAVSAIYNYEK